MTQEDRINDLEYSIEGHNIFLWIIGVCVLVIIVVGCFAVIGHYTYPKPVSKNPCELGLMEWEYETEEMLKLRYELCIGDCGGIAYYKGIMKECFIECIGRIVEKSCPYSGEIMVVKDG